MGKKELEEEKARKQHMAVVFYQNLLKRRGLALFKRMAKRNDQIGLYIIQRRNDSVLRRYFDAWRCIAQYQRQRDTLLIGNFHEKQLKCKTLRQWRRLLTIDENNAQLAARFYESSLVKKYFISWNEMALESKLAEWRHIKVADDFNDQLTLRRAMRAFKSLKHAKRVERERDARKLKLKMLVQEVLPDYS